MPSRYVRKTNQTYRNYGRGGRTFASETDRFMATVMKTDSCWLWTGTVTRNRPRYRGMYASRFAYTLMVDPHADIRGLDVCHSCDNGMCVRPDHLFISTREENIRDAIQKGLWQRRSLNADAARSLLAEGLNQSEVARRLGVSHTAVWNLVHRTAKATRLSASTSRGETDCSV